MLAPKCRGNSLRKGIDIIDCDHGVLGDIAAQDTPLREADGQSIDAASRRGVFDEAVGAETTDAVEPLAFFQIPLGHADHFADRTIERRNSGIAMNDRAADGGSDLEMR